MSVTVAGFTAGAIALVSDQVIAALRLTDELAVPATGNSLGKVLLLFIILVPALYLTHIIINWLATRAFRLDWVRRLILRQDYVEGYWLVENRIDGYLISTGFMHYQIVDEQLKITGAHFSSFDDPNKPKKIAETVSFAADCDGGVYYNHFNLPGVGLGVANGTFSSSGCGGSIPDSFQVEVVIATPPSRVFEWGKNALDWISSKENTGFTNLSGGEKNELIASMAKGRVVTMHQFGERLDKKVLEEAREANPKTYKRVLAKNHYEDLHAHVS